MKSNRTQPPNSVSRPPGLLLAILLCLLAPLAGWAASDAWTNGAPDLNWSSSANWTNGVPTSTSDVLFVTNSTALDPVTINNTVDASTLIQTLSYVHTNYFTGSQTYHNTYINDGMTLVVSNNLTTDAVFVGARLSLVNPATRASISGANASLVVIASNGVFNVRQGGSQNYSGTAVLDMSGLSNCTIRAQRVLVAGDGTNGSAEKDRASGLLKLGLLNYLFLGATATPPGLTLGYNIGNGGVGGSLTLGQTNYIYSSYGLAVGMTRSSACALNFGPFSSPYAWFRNAAGTGRQSYWLIGDSSTVGYSGNATAGTADFTGGTVDAQVDQLIVGRSVNDTKGLNVGGTVGTLTLNDGTLDVNTATIGYMMNNYCAKVQGTVNVDGTAQLIANTSMQLGRFMNSDVTNGVSFAVLNIGTASGSGSVIVKGNITTTAAAANHALNDSEIIMRNSASLYVKGSIGPLYNFELNNSTLTLDFGASPNPAVAVCAATNLLTGPASVVKVSGTGLLVGQFPLIKYQTWNGSDADLTLNAPQLEGYLSNNVANSSLDLVITNLVADTWNGNLSGDWDINLTANWKDSNGGSTTYKEPVAPGDVVIFDDSATGTTTVNLTTNVSPTAIDALNSAKNYTFTGTGSLSGPTGLYKNGSGTLVLANSGSNGFTGPVTIGGGTLRLGGGADRLPTSSTVSFMNAAGAALDLNSENQTLSAISGGGASGGNIALGSGALTVTSGGTSFGGVISGTGMLIKTNSGTLTLSGASTYSGGTLVISNTTLAAINTTGSGSGTGNIDIEGATLFIGSTTHGGGGAYGSVSATAITNNTVGSTGWLYVNRSDTVNFTPVLYGSGQMYLGDGPGRVIVDHANYHSGQTTSGYGPIRVSHSNALGTGLMLVGGLANAALELLNNVTLTNTINVAQKGGALGAPAHVINVSDTNTLAGTINLNSGGSDWVFRPDGGKLVIRGSLINVLGATRNYWLRGNADGEVYSGFPLGVYVSPYQPTNNLTKDGLGTWTLWGTNTYNGTTIVSNGTLIVNGAITPAALSANSNVVVYAGMLGGTGLITCPVIISNSASFSPGAYNNSIGTLTISNNLIFGSSSTCVMDLSASGGYDQVRGIKTVNYSGTLKVNLSGALHGGEIFKLFSATTYGAVNFSSFSLPAIPSELSWDTNQLTMDGTLRVAGGNIHFGQLGHALDGNFVMGGSSAAAGQGYRVLATTNVADPLSWIQVGSGTFNAGDGSFAFTDLTSTNYPQRYYRVVMP